MHEVLVNRLGGLSLPRKSVDRLTDRPYMTLDVYRGRKTTTQQQQYGKFKGYPDSDTCFEKVEKGKIMKLLDIISELFSIVDISGI